MKAFEIVKSGFDKFDSWGLNEKNPAMLVAKRGFVGFVEGAGVSLACASVIVLISRASIMIYDQIRKDK